VEYVTFWLRLPYAAGLVTLQIFDEADCRVCGIYRIEGRVALRPKAWLAAIRSEIQTIERIAKDAGCHELRVSGRDWRRVLTDYEPMVGNEPNLIRKRLL